ncbi:MAG: tripartite tricarboxylate transporter TctB family protein [Syntrophales bacterium]
MHAKWKDLLWAFLLTMAVVYLYIDVGRETALITATLKGYPAAARPNFWPRVMLAGLLVTGLVKLYLNARKRVDHEREQESAPRILMPKVIISVVIVGLYCYLSQYLGFAFATIVFTAGYMWFLGMRKLKLLVSFPILSTLVILLVFWRVLYIAVPKGVGIFLTFSNLVMSIVRVGA